MAANEIAERLAAACWVQAGSAGGEAIADYTPAQLRYRSYVGFQNRIITTVDGQTVPLIILPLDHTFSRNETAVFAMRHATVGPSGPALAPTDRSSYPLLAEAAGAYANVWVQPILLAWLGDDLSAPTFMPMGLVGGASDVPDDLSIDTFDAIAVLLPSEDDVALAGDFSVLVLKHPPREADTIVLQVLPVS